MNTFFEFPIATISDNLSVSSWKCLSGLCTTKIYCNILLVNYHIYQRQ